MKIKPYIILFFLSLILCLSCDNTSKNNTESRITIIDSMIFNNNYAQYLVSCEDTNRVNLYNYGVPLLDRHPLGSVIGFYHQIDDSCRFKKNGAIPNGIYNKMIGRMYYDSLQNNYILASFKYENGALIEQGTMCDTTLIW